MTNTIESWETIKQFYKDKFGIDKSTVDLMSDMNTLKLCSTGASSESIANFLGISILDVIDTIQIYFDFMGWEENLPYNPLAVYRGVNADLGRYKEYTLSEYLNEEVSDLSYRVCKKYSELEEVVNEKWV